MTMRMGVAVHKKSLPLIQKDWKSRAAPESYVNLRENPYIITN